MLLPGDPAPDFVAASNVNPKYHFDVAAGRYIVLSFFGSSKLPVASRLLDEVRARKERFNVRDAVFFGVSVDPEDPQRLTSDWPGIMYFWDLDLAISRKYGVLAAAHEARPSDATNAEEPAQGSDREPADPGSGRFVYAARTIVLDEGMRIVALMSTGSDPVEHLNQVMNVLDELPALDQVSTPAPVLTIPYVFEPELCQRLMAYYEAHGGEESGFMRDVGGKTVGLSDYSHKRRKDCEITDTALIKATQERLYRRVLPAIRKAFNFNATRIERHIVACYDAAEGGHFRAHRDNTTLGTAHRRFAVTLNLNADEFTGGELWFPEFGHRRYRATTGGAVVFSCSLLHEATPVTQGRRYAFLPFLYDDAAAAVRQKNRQFLEPNNAVRANEST